jgi:hypothetical protein
MEIKLDFSDIEEAIVNLDMSREEQEELISLVVNKTGISFEDTTMSILNVIKESYCKYDFECLLEVLNRAEYQELIVE